MPKWEQKVYIGDGVYASFDGYQIRLTTETGMGVPTNTIYLELGLFPVLKRYVEKVTE